MSESKAAEDYKIFESLRNRFSDATVSSSSPPSRPEPRKSSKRRFDPRSNAPPLKPLIEEGDQLQEAMVSGSSSAVKGTWKHTKCNHLNGPDFDALETSSTTSLSSAYSEPGTFSPPMGSSLSELSDSGSCETFSEYDFKRNKQQQPRISSLKASFEHNNSSHSRNSKHKEIVSDADVPEKFVNTSKKAWDKAIGDWKFNGVQQSPVASPSKPKMRQPSSEVRVPTPLSTPLGSSDNLLNDSGSRSSVLSNNESTVSSEDYPNGWNFERKPCPGRLLNKPPSRPSSASCIPTNYQRKSPTVTENDDRSSSETNLLLQTSSTIEPAQNDDSSSQSNTEKESDEDAACLQPREFKMGKFLSISDTMLPAEERTHEYIAESLTPPPVRKVADKAVKMLEAENTPEESNGDKKQVEEEGNKEEKVVEDEVPQDYQPGKFVPRIDPIPQLEETKDTTADEDTEKSDPPSIVEVELGKFVSQSNTTSPPEEVDDVTADLEKPIPIAITDLESEKAAKDVPDRTSEQSSKMENKAQPSNRWFDAYMKCKAAQEKAAPIKKRIPPVIKEAPVKKLEKQEEPQAPKEPPVNASVVDINDFEKVQKITPSRSQKWREAMQKYKALEQKATSQNVQASSGEEENSQSSAVKSPQKSAEEPTYSSLAQRAQMFGGMRKKPPLRRAKSFQIGSSDSASSPLATGLTRPTKVLKRQTTASSFN